MSRFWAIKHKTALMQFFFLRTKLLYGKSTMKGSVLQIDPETKKNRRKSSLIDFVGSLRTHAILGEKTTTFQLNLKWQLQTKIAHFLYHFWRLFLRVYSDMNTTSKLALGVGRILKNISWRALTSQNQDGRLPVAFQVMGSWEVFVG